MSEVVFDASALLALIQEEPGSKAVESYLGRAVVSTVNLSEVVAQLIKRGMPKKLASSVLNGMGLKVMDFDEELALQAAFLIEITHKEGLSFGDRACLALAQNLKIPAITTDRAWSKLKIPVNIKLVR